jgi:hypothetical protein
LTIYQYLNKDCDNNVNTAGNYYFKRDGSSVSASTSPGTNGNLNIWQVETTTTTTPGSASVAQYVPPVSGSTEAPPVEDGTYVIYNPSSDIVFSSETKTNSGGAVGFAPATKSGSGVTGFSLSGDILTTDIANAYEITHKTDGAYNEYYIKNSEGKYLTITAGTNNSLTFSDNASSVFIYGRTQDADTIHFYSGQTFVDYFSSNGNVISTWGDSSSNLTSNTNGNTIYKLYAREEGTVEVPAGKEELYNALVEGVSVVPGTYSNASYQPLFAALEDGYAVFKDENASADQIAAATAAIATAMAGLEVEYKSLSTTLYKYGYNASATGANRYANGGATFNTLTYAGTKAMLEDENGPYLAQIKTAIGYDTNTWASDTEKATALETAIDKYARGRIIISDATPQSYYTVGLIIVVIRPT